jgi:CubicO group peptidase (beta-lactamase class C family)
MPTFFSSRRAILLGGAAALLSDPLRKPALAAEWPSATPEEAGFAPDLGARIDEAVRGGRVPNLHGVVVVRDGRLVVERYYDGPDEHWGRPLGQVAFAPGTLHDLRSVTKSIVGVLYGIALAAGRVPAPDQPLMAQFPEYPDLAADPRRARLTIGHVLTMTMGTEWNEDVPYTSAANSEVAMEMAADRYRFILDRPIVADAGTRWTYSGGATALLGRLIAMGTGQSLPDYARQALFDPLGIGATEWTRGPNGEPSAASGLRMTPRDLARIGHLVGSGGEWNGRRIVPADWLTRSTAPVVTIDEFRRFGFHWYSGEFPADAAARNERWIGAFGNGGQRLFVLPAIGLTIAITAGNYNTPDQWRPPITLVRQVVLPNLRSP